MYQQNIQPAPEKRPRAAAFGQSGGRAETGAGPRHSARLGGQKRRGGGRNRDLVGETEKRRNRGRGGCVQLFVHPCSAVMSPCLAPQRIADASSNFSKL